MEGRRSKVGAGDSVEAVPWLLALVLFGLLIGLWACLWIPPFP
jgi:hypothetical protein